MLKISIVLWWCGGVFLAAIAVIVFILYFRGTFRDRIEYKVLNVPSPDDPRFRLAVANLSNSVATTGNYIEHWVEAENICAARIAAIKEATDSIHFETFFMTPGRRANDFADAICDRAQAGVAVQMIVDYHGTKKLSKRYWKRLQACGVDVRFFNKFSWKAPIDYFARTHRKLLIIDSKKALIGGAGVSDFWDGIDNIKDTGAWYDFEMSFTGEVVAALYSMFMQHWTYVHGTADLNLKILNSSSPEPEMLITAGDAPSYRSSSVKALFLTSIHAAKHRVWISSPYFLPDRDLRASLIIAQKKGVQIRILTNGSECDKKYVYYASCELYGDLLAAGIEINEYQPSMMHAKALLLDDCWISTGSANFDPRSFFHNDELDISTAQPELVNHIENLLIAGFSRCKQINISTWRKRELWKRVLGRIVLFFQSQL